MKCLSRDEYYPFHESMRNEDNLLTAAMEDYLEMIYRLSLNSGFTRVRELSKALNVHSSSVTKMVQKLAKLKLIQYERYDVLILCEEGKRLGHELLARHNIIESFVKLIGVSDEYALQEAEKIEHTVSRSTAKCIELLLAFMQANPEILEQYKKYQLKAFAPDAQTAHE